MTRPVSRNTETERVMSGVLDRESLVQVGEMDGRDNRVTQRRVMDILEAAMDIAFFLWCL